MPKSYLLPSAIFSGLALIVFAEIHLDFATRGRIPIDQDWNTCPSNRSGLANYLDITDCANSFPCTMRREKVYDVIFNFSPKYNTSFMRIKCGTMYLGQPQTLRDINVCDHLDAGSSCPLTAGSNYSYATVFRIPYYVPPTTYKIYCQLADDTGMNTMCGSGAAKLV